MDSKLQIAIEGLQQIVDDTNGNLYDLQDIANHTLFRINSMPEEKEAHDALLREAYEWWEYYLSKAENDRLVRKYYPEVTTQDGYPRFFMDEDKLKIYLQEK